MNIRVSTLLHVARFFMVFLVSLMTFEVLSVGKWLVLALCLVGIAISSSWIGAAGALRDVSLWLTEELKKAKETLGTKMET